MSETSSFTFTNTTAGDGAATVAMNMVTNYGKIQDEPEEVILTNRTATMDQPETVSYRGRKIKRVATVNTISYPCRVQDGVEYGVRLDEVLRTKDENGNVLWDDPIVATITFKHHRSAYVTPTIMNQVLSRLLGAMYDETSNCFRWKDLMLSALVPSED